MVEKAIGQLLFLTVRRLGGMESARNLVSIWTGRSKQLAWSNVTSEKDYCVNVYYRKLKLSYILLKE